jgi:hypothetical protein
MKILFFIPLSQIFHQFNGKDNNLGGSKNEIQASLRPSDSNAGKIIKNQLKKSVENCMSKKIFQTLHGSPKNVQIYPTQSYPTQAFQSNSGQSVNASPVPSTRASHYTTTTSHNNVVSILCQGRVDLFSPHLILMTQKCSSINRFTHFTY